MPAQFTVTATKERVEKAIISIGKKDIQEMIDDGKRLKSTAILTIRIINYSRMN